VSLEIMYCQIDFDWSYGDTKPSEMINSKSAITGVCPHIACTFYSLQLKSVKKMSILFNNALPCTFMCWSLSHLKRQSGKLLHHASDWMTIALRILCANKLEMMLTAKYSLTA
jgi:hypothetical protein